SNSHKRMILLVDDTPANIQMAHNILKDTYTIRIATSGGKALGLAKALPQPDLILLDVMMPEMDGYEVCSRLKADPGTCDIPIIFITGKTDAEDETRGFELGAIDYIHKPFSPLVVQARVRTHLTLREAREQLTEEKHKVDCLLDNILPPRAVSEIKLTGEVIPRRFENVAVLFSDLVGFTNYCDQHAPEEVVSELGDLFVVFERCARRHGLEKIKTIGDAFLATAGLLAPVDDPLGAAVSCALAISEEATRSGRGWQVRSGVHIGPLMAGVVGHERYQFDVWGDTVNVASRLTGAASPGAVALTEQMSACLQGFAVSQRGAVELKGKGSVRMVQVTAIAEDAPA
ncbi:MAG: adenylate/guanylate cyclase domain-containing protein, partial [Bryobacteraceae bacterium]